MKNYKTFINMLVACLLAGASGFTMARNDCPEGSLVGGSYTEIVIDTFVSCKIIGVHVEGKVQVTGADQFVMQGSFVDGDVTVGNTVLSSLVGNQVYNGNLVNQGNGFSAVLRNIVKHGSLRVLDDLSAGEFVREQEVIVHQNFLYSGNLLVLGNEKADVKENKVLKGNIECKYNDRLDSTDNNAFGGKDECNKSLF